jgi:hypothetical protein
MNNRTNKDDHEISDDGDGSISDGDDSQQMTDRALDGLINKVYYTPGFREKHGGAFANVATLRRSVNTILHEDHRHQQKVSIQKIQDFLKRQEVYRRYKKPKAIRK